MKYKMVSNPDQKNTLQQESINAFDIVKDVISKHTDFVNDYNSFSHSYKKRILTASEAGTAYDLFMPETKLLWFNNLGGKYAGKIIEDESLKERANYFDENGQLIFIEEFSRRNQSELIGVTLYYNYTDTIDILSFSVSNGLITRVGRIEYENGKATRLVVKDFSLYPSIYRFDGDKIFSYDVFIMKNGKAQGEIIEIIKPEKKPKRSQNKSRDVIKISLKDSIKSRIEKSILELKADDIYAFSLYVEDDCSDETRPTVTFGFNTLKNYEKATERASDSLEAKWNFAFWLQNEIFVYGMDETASDVENWIEQNNLLDDKDEKTESDTPKITRAFVNELIKAVKEIHNDRVLTSKFGKELPIIIHELEYYDEIAEQNIKANGKRLLGDFLEFCPPEY